MRETIQPVRHPDRAYPVGEERMGSVKISQFGFDVTSTFTFDAAAAAPGQSGPTMTIYQVPAAVQQAEVRWFALEAIPRGIFLNNVAWSLRISQAGGQEYQQESRVSGTTPRPPEDGGLRWGPQGSLGAPLSVTILLTQDQILEATFTHVLQQTAGAPFTIYARAAGVIYS